MSRNKSNKNGVGYKNPPDHSRWKKGQSGNPNGRPSKDKSLEVISNEHLNEIIINAGLKPMEFIEGGKRKTAPRLFIMLSQLSAKAAAGDLRATKQYIKLMERATKVKDKMRHEWIMAWTDMREEKLKVQNKKGTLVFFNVMYKYYMFKKNIRHIEGADQWPIELHEPITTEDWVVFITHHEALKNGTTDIAPWPLDYPSGN